MNASNNTGKVIKPHHTQTDNWKDKEHQSEKITQYKIKQPGNGDDDNDFSKYADPHDYNVMSIEGLVKFFSDLGIDGDGVESLYLLYIMDTEELNIIKYSEYKNLLSKACVHSAVNAKGYVKAEIAKINESQDHLK